jgi:hypothetical protein
LEAQVPFLKRQFCWSAVLAYLLPQGCASRSFDQSDGNDQNETLQVASPSGGSAAEFLKGLSGNFASSERLNSGKMLEQYVATLPSSSTKTFLEMSAQYLQSTQRCDPSARVRVFRGVGGQPLIRDGKLPLDNIGNPTGGKSLAPGPGVNLLPDALRRLTAHLKAQGVETGRAKDPGVAIFAALNKSTLTLNEMFELGTGVGGRPIDSVAMSHTITSKRSPFHSTTLLESVAVRFAGAGRSKVRYIALDMCPERIFPVSNSSSLITFNEAEIYSPFFLLPEEITAVVDCSAPQDAKTCSAVWGSLGVGRPAPNSGTANMGACYFNFDSPYEQERNTLFKWTPPHYQKKVFPEFVSTMSNLKSGSSVSDWRTYVAGVAKPGGVCESSCARSDDFWARKSAPGVNISPSLQTDYQAVRKGNGCN